MLSRGARLCEQIIRHSRRVKGGAHQCGRPYLARRLGCTTRTVSRYVKELRDAGRLEVTPPRRVKRRDGWRTVGTNVYRLPCSAHPAPHVQGRERLRRSRRDDTHVTPSPNGDRSSAPTGRFVPEPWVVADRERPRTDTSAARAKVRAAIKRGRAA